MSAPVRQQLFSYPGALSIESASYTISHGISPGLIVVTMNPQDFAPDLVGNAVFADGVESVIIPNCRLANFRPTQGSNGLTWQMELEDRRWKWRECAAIGGLYNQPDPTGQFAATPPGVQITSSVKYVPWTVRSYQQLLAYCLDAMGETGYTIVLPDTLNVPTDVLPAVHWDYQNPAQALSSLANSLGCRVVYRLDTDTVLVCPVGVGGTLPDGSIAHEALSVKLPPRPDSIVCVGAPIRYQARFVLEAVGDEWDGKLKNIEYLSYAPAKPASRVAQWVLTPTSVTSGDTFTVLFDGNIVASYTAAASTVADVCTGLALALNNSPYVQNYGIRAFNTTSSITPYGPADGTTPEFGVTATGTSQITWTLKVSGTSPTTVWGYAHPPSFMNVQATSRLTVHQARDKARKSVFLKYRIVNLDPDSRTFPYTLPGSALGPLVRTQQVLLGQTKLDRSYPDAGDANIFDKTGEPITRWFYDGMSREQPASCYGAYSVHGIVYNQKPNTDPDDEVLVPFRIDPQEQCVIFSQPVFLRTKGGWIKPAELVLETSFTLRHPVTNAVRRSEITYLFPPPYYGTAPAVIHREDVQLLAAARYVATVPGDPVKPATYQVTGIDTTLAEATTRANYYLLTEATKYQTKDSGSRQYNGIRQIWLDGAIQQVSWSVGSGGAHTQASRNAEHDAYWPQYPAKLQVEYLAAATVRGERRRPQADKPPKE